MEEDQALNVLLNMAAVAVQFAEEDEDDEEEIILMAVRLAADEVAEVMAMEDGEGLGTYLSSLFSV